MLSDSDYQKLDAVTRKLFVSESCEDPFCCAVLRHTIVNNLRQQYGLSELDSAKDDYDLKKRSRSRK